MTVETVAGILCCGEKHVRDLIVDGKIAAIRIGSRAIRISEKSLHDFIECSRVNPEELFDPDNSKLAPGKSEMKPEVVIAKSRWMTKGHS